MQQIILYGTGDSGKSTTLRKLYYNHIESNSDYVISEGSANPNGDFMIILNYQNRKKIGIYTWGDNLYHVSKGQEFASKCDIAICAVRSKGEGYRLLNGLSYPQIWIEKGRFNAKNGIMSVAEEEKIQNKLDTQTANQIFQILESLL